MRGRYYRPEGAPQREERGIQGDSDGSTWSAQYSKPPEHSKVFLKWSIFHIICVSLSTGKDGIRFIKLIVEISPTDMTK